MKATVLLQSPESTKESEAGVPEGSTSSLELRLGMSVGSGDHLVLMDRHKTSSTGSTGAGSQKRIRCFAETAPAAGRSGFVDPWSLAARQEKAALEQAIKQPQYPSSNFMASRSMNPPPPPPSSMPAVVGWPPVRSFRRNLGAPPPQQHAKPSVVQKLKQDVAVQGGEEEEEEEEEEVKVQMEDTMDDDNDGNGVSSNNDDAKNTSNAGNGGSMFVKVNMEGYAVGRKIDLKAHRCYDSLSRALQNMFRNLLSAANYSNKSKQDGEDEVHSPNYVLLYEDNEGDKMLVGDVPWEMFISSVKRLYITVDQRKYQTNVKC